MQNAVSSVLNILAMLFIGWLTARKGWVDDRVSGIFSKILIAVALPGLIISNFSDNFTREGILSCSSGLLIAFVSVLLSYGISMAVSRIFRIEPKRRGTFQTMFAFSNTMFIGLPVNLSLFGEASVPYVLLYYLANTLLFWTIGMYSIRKDIIINDNDSNGVGIERKFGWDNIKKILSPPIAAFFIAVIFIMLDIKLPGFLMDTFRYMGNLSTPMSMLFIGAIIYFMGFKGIKFDRDMIILLIGRFIISPLIIAAMMKIIRIPDLMGKVFIIQSAMPVITQSAVSARAYGGDYRYASAAVTVSTIAGLLFIPLYMYIMR